MHMPIEIKSQNVSQDQLPIRVASWKFHGIQKSSSCQKVRYSQHLERNGQYLIKKIEKNLPTKDWTILNRYSLSLIDYKSGSVSRMPPYLNKSEVREGLAIIRGTLINSED